MAEDKKVAIEVEVKGTSQSIESLKDLKAAIKAAKDEQVKTAAAFGTSSQEYINASKKLGELKDSMDDLNDSTQSLRGSGVEGLSSSFGMLGDGLKNLDLDKIKTGFKGLGSAMSAIPLLLIVSGITMLAEKFGIFEMITDAVVQVLYAFTDAIGLTNKADEKAANEMIENAQNVQKVKDEQYNNEIKKATAAGKSIKQLELDKLKATEISIESQVLALENLQTKKGKLNDEEQKNYNDLQISLLKASGDREAKEIANNKEKVDKVNAYNLTSSNISEDLRIAKLSDREKQIDVINKAAAAKKAELNKNQTVDSEIEFKRLAESEKQIEQLRLIEIVALSKDANKKLSDDKIESEKSAWAKTLEIRASNREAQEAEDARIAKEKEEQLKLDAQAQLDYMKSVGNEENAFKLSQAEFDKQLVKLTEAQKVDITRNALQSVQQLSDIFFMFKSKKAAKGSKEEEDLARKQFNFNKGLQLGLAAIDGFKSITASLAQSPIAVGVVPNPAGIASLAFASITAATNIAKIAASQFKSSGGGGGGVSAPSAPNISVPPPPVISTASNNLNSSTSFDENGKRIGGEQKQTISINATIGVDEVKRKMDKVDVLEKQSTF